MASIKQLKDKDGNPIFPITHTNAIFDSNGNRIEDIIEDELSNITKSLDKTENTKYSTENGVNEFNCKDGYIDNVVIEGETLINLVEPLKKSITETTNGTYLIMLLNNAGRTLGVSKYTVFNFCDRHIRIDIRTGTPESSTFTRAERVAPFTSAAFVLNTNEYISNYNGAYSDGWADTDADANTLKNSCVVLEGDHTNKSISYFEGLKSVGQGDNIEVLSRNEEGNIFDGKLELGMIDDATGKPLDHASCVRSKNFIPIKDNTPFIMWSDKGYGIYNYYYDSNKNFIKASGDIPSNARYFKFRSVIGNIENDASVKYVISYTGIDKYIKPQIDKKQISTTLRSLPNGVKDTIEKRGNKYVKVQRCSEIVLNGNSTVLGISEASSSAKVYRVLLDLPENNNKATASKVFCDKFNSYANWNLDEEDCYASVNDNEGNVIILKILKSKLGNTMTKEKVSAWLNTNPVTLVYELNTPIITELPNFNPQIYSDSTTLFLNTGAVQGECEFEVTNSKVSEIEVLKDKVSVLDGLGDGDITNINTIADTVKDLVYNGTAKDSKGTNLHKSAPDYYFRNRIGCDLNTVFENVYTQTTGNQSLVNLPIGENGGYGIFECKVTYNGSALTHVVQKFYNTRFNIEYTRQYNFDQVAWTIWAVTTGSCYINNKSFNDAIGDGHYYLTTCTDGPEGGTAGAWFLEVVTRRDGLYIYQRATKCLNTDSYLPKYERIYYNGTWTAWRYL